MKANPHGSLCFSVCKAIAWSFLFFPQGDIASRLGSVANGKCRIRKMLRAILDLAGIVNFEEQSSLFDVDR